MEKDAYSEDRDWEVKKLILRDEAEGPEASKINKNQNRRRTGNLVWSLLQEEEGRGEGRTSRRGR